MASKNADIGELKEGQTADHRAIAAQISREDPAFYNRPAAQRILTDIFVRRWLIPSKHSVQIAWIKVVAEHVMREELYGDFPACRFWIGQAEVEAALIRAGYRIRRSRTDKTEVYAHCALRGETLNQHRFWMRGGHWPGAKRRKGKS